MSYAMDYVEQRMAAEASADARAAFIRRTYGHLALAILAFIAVEALLLQVIPRETVLSMFSGRFTWLIVLGAFMGVSWLANSWAQSDTSVGTQYAGLALYVVAEAVIFLPLLCLATLIDPDGRVIANAGILTLMVFAGLTATVFITRHDFSYLGMILTVGGFIALGVIVCAMLFGFGLGLWFSLLMVGFASACILYQTSNVLHRYRVDQHVAAALALFASVALLFWYILQIFLSSRD